MSIKINNIDIQFGRGQLCLECKPFSDRMILTICSLKEPKPLGQLVDEHEMDGGTRVNLLFETKEDIKALIKMLNIIKRNKKVH